MNFVSEALSKLAGKPVDFPNDATLNDLAEFCPPLGLEYVTTGKRMVQNGVPCVLFWYDDQKKIHVEYAELSHDLAQMVLSLGYELIAGVFKAKKGKRK